jgi:hypothetical protein
MPPLVTHRQPPRALKRNPARRATGFTSLTLQLHLGRRRFAPDSWRATRETERINQIVYKDTTTTNCGSAMQHRRRVPFPTTLG